MNTNQRMVSPTKLKDKEDMDELLENELKINASNKARSSSKGS